MTAKLMLKTFSDLIQDIMSVRFTVFQRCNADHFIPLVQVRRVHQLLVAKMTAKYFKVSSHILCRPLHNKTGDTLCCQAIDLLQK